MAPTILVVDDNKELVALLTSLFEGVGYSVVGAGKGRTAIDAAKENLVQLALIDVLLPDMMGYHVAEALHQEMPSLPVIFMSGVFKGSRHSTEAAKRFPGSTYLEKPFDAKKLLEQVSGLVPPPPPSTEAAPTVDNQLDVELDIDVEDDDSDSQAMELTGRIKVMGGGDITAELRGAALTATKPVQGPVSGERPRVSLASGIIATPSGLHRPGRQGALADNLPGLVSAFYLSKETGELYCQRGKVKKVVYFQDGQPVYALSNLAADRFGQFLVRVGKIRPEQLQDVAVVAAQTKRRTGDVLIERGLLKETERLYYVAQQVKSIIYSLFGWEDGRYAMGFGEKARAETIKLDLFPGTLILRGIKKLYKPERLARIVRLEDRLIPTQQPAYQLHELELDKWEAQLLSRVDGTRTTAELLALAQRPDHQVRGFLAAMLGVEVLERRDP
jgi:two-component system, OmpR family, response regulator